MASTIKDVARMAGVSISTVSRVTNNAPNVSPAIRRKVQRAIKALNYTPNILARSLEAQSMKNIAIVMGRTTEQAFFNSDFFEILHGITSTLALREYNSLLLTDTNLSVELEHCIQLIHSSTVQGVIVMGSFTHDPLLQRLLEEEHPFVLVGYPSDYPDIYSTPYNTVATQDYDSAYAAVHFLIENGHQRIGLIHANLANVSSQKRYDGYIDAITEACIPLDHTLIAPADFNLSEIFLAAKQMLTVAKPPTAIFCTDDYKAIGVIHTANQLGLKVPDDLSVIGHNNYRISQLSIPPLTTIALPLFDMGRTAAEILLNNISNPDVPVKNIYKPFELLIRETVKKL